MTRLIFRSLAGLTRLVQFPISTNWRREYSLFYAPEVTVRTVFEEEAEFKNESRLGHDTVNFGFSEDVLYEYLRQAFVDEVGEKTKKKRRICLCFPCDALSNKSKYSPPPALRRRLSSCSPSDASGFTGMVLKMLGAAADRFPREYTAHIVTALLALVATRRISQGRQTTRERDMHGRVVVLTGAFTPVGLTLLEHLAQRGAHVIALTPHPVDSEHIATYIELLQSTTSNENITSPLLPPSTHLPPVSPRAATRAESRLPTAPDLRTDALSSGNALATFFLITLFLPMMLVAPIERDLRIAFESVSSASASSPPTTTPTPHLLPESTRPLRPVLVTRNVQRILDALPSARSPFSLPPSPHPPPPPPSLTHRPRTPHKSNIIAVSVTPRPQPLRDNRPAAWWGFVW
ncbi:hypothetical protein R3P38DRAFT_3177844 [Favolaschia claudopus]|uniref:Uncharacterized protein n=1 Tax=Favolaschia claudopus TaxID=2862362 RepID=A0AAW0CWD4_9AGAR